MLFTAAAAVVLQLALLVLPPVHVQLAHPAIGPELHTALSVRIFSKIKSVNTWTTVTGRKRPYWVVPCSFFNLALQLTCGTHHNLIAIARSPRLAASDWLPV